MYARVAGMPNTPTTLADQARPRRWRTECALEVLAGRTCLRRKSAERAPKIGALGAPDVLTDRVLAGQIAYMACMTVGDMRVVQCGRRRRGVEEMGSVGVV